MNDINWMKPASLKKQLTDLWTLSIVSFFFVFKQLFRVCTPSSGKRPSLLGPINEEKASILEGHSTGHSKQKVYM
jgi:hypothetical protein